MTIDTTTILILWIMAVHWLADFVCQSDRMAKGKSTSHFWLTLHVLTYTAIMSILIFIFPNPWAGAGYVLLNGVLHWFTDYFTSRWSSRFFQKQDSHNGFVIVGLDQWIHLACLTLTLEAFH